MQQPINHMQLTVPSPAKIFTPAVTVIIISMIIGFILSIVASDFTIAYLALSKHGIFQGRIWQLASYSLINISPGDLVFSALMLLFIGSNLEKEWRTKPFIMLWLAISIACGILWLLINILFGTNFIGSSTAGCNYGLIGAFGLLNRDKKFLTIFGAIEAKILFLILIGIGVILNIAQPINLIWVSGAGVAYIYIKLLWRVAARKSINNSKNNTRKAKGFVDID